MEGSGKAAPLYAGALLGGSILGIQKNTGSVDGCHVHWEL